MARDLLSFVSHDLLPRLSVETLYAGVQFSSRHGRYWRAACPLHGGDNATAFSVDTETLSWHCFSHCGSGSALAFLNGGTAPTGAAFVEIVRRLAALAGVAMPEDDLTPERQAQRSAEERHTHLLERALAHAQEALHGPEGASARAYLQRRGFPVETLSTLPFGLYSDPVTVELQLIEEGFSADEVEDSGLVTPTWRGRLVGPWRDRWGRLATLFARDLSGAADSGAKYLYLRGTTKRDLVALGLEVALRAPEGRRNLLLVEGLLDVTLLQALGWSAVAAIGGSGREMTASRLSALAGYGVQALTLLLDNDDAGRAGTLAVLEAAQQVSDAPAIFVIDPAALGTAKDPDDLVRTQGIVALQRLIEQRVPGAVYAGLQLLAGVTPTSGDGERRTAVERLLDYAAALDGVAAALDRDDLLGLAAAQTGYARTTLGELAAERLVQRRRDAVARDLDRLLQQATVRRQSGGDAVETLHRLLADLEGLRQRLDPPLL